MKKLRWQLIIIFLTGLVVGILLLGEQPGALQNTLAPQPAQGGIYTEALVGSPQRLNPVLDYYNPVDRDLDRLVFSGLLRFDERGLPQGDLAQSWGVSQDGTIYNFTLRKDIFWHDGQPVTAEDVLYTINLMRNSTNVFPPDVQAFWKDIEVKGLNDSTLQFLLPEPFAPFLDYLTFGILPKHVLGDISFDDLIKSPFNMQPIGSGPFRFDHLDVENGKITGVELSAFDKYYGKKPFIQQMIFRYYSDSASALQAYQQGNVQGISQVTPDILQPVLADKNLSIYTGRKPELSIIMLNLNDPQSPFLQDPNVRRALLLGLNRQWIIDHLLNGQAVMADGPILPGTWAYYDGIEHLDYDQTQAQNMLKDAGYVLSGDQNSVRKKGDTALQFTLSYPDDDAHKAIAIEIQKEWNALGANINLDAQPYDQLVNAELGQRKYQAALVDLNLSRSPDPDPYPFWDQAQATGGQNYSQWNDRTASEYLEQARITTDLTERTRLYRNFQVIFSQQLPSLPLYYPVYTYAVDQQIQGVRMGPLFDTSDRFVSVLDWFLVAKRPTQSDVTPTANGK
ncbi:MAG: peptide ABC transporter substrate-binding protein [Anaerolineaceae bacterium]|nr:peptide ABC transporter substrate-binding protein [Anaerolineaceae bacterium]